MQAVPRAVKNIYLFAHDLWPPTSQDGKILSWCGTSPVATFTPLTGREVDGLPWVCVMRHIVTKDNIGILSSHCSLRLPIRLDDTQVVFFSLYSHLLMHLFTWVIGGGMKWADCMMLPGRNSVQDCLLILLSYISFKNCVTHQAYDTNLIAHISLWAICLSTLCSRPCI